jgi:hypothetical protein
MKALMFGVHATGIGARTRSDRLKALPLAISEDTDGVHGERSPSLRATEDATDALKVGRQPIFSSRVHQLRHASVRSRGRSRREFLAAAFANRSE